MATTTTVTAGREALGRYAWQDAHRLLSEVPENELGADDWEGLAEASWWSGRMDECLAAREQAYRGYLDDGDEAKAAAQAMHLSKNYASVGQKAQAAGWHSRAERLLKECDECLEHGYMALDRSMGAFGADNQLALDEAQRALEIAERHQDRGLMARAIYQQGDVLMRQGKVDEGLALMDEATAAAVSGELEPMSTAIIYCWTISTCRDLADYGRAGEWTEAAKRWCERQAIAGFPGMCRVYRAEIMRLRGSWAEAEREARIAAQELRSFSASSAGQAFYEIGEIRLRMGDLPGAEEAFSQASELGVNPQPGLAMLRLEEGGVDVASRCLDAALEDTEDALWRARLLPAKVEVAIRGDDLAGAEQALAELEQTAAQFATSGLNAVLQSARGRLLLVRGDLPGAVRELQQARRSWETVNAPYEAAEARLLLGQALKAQGYEEDAQLHLQGALAGFDKLGALTGSRRARALLGEPGGTATGAQAGAQAGATFMFTDIVKSTDLVEAIGDEAFKDLLHWHDDTLRTLFARHAGEEVDKAGDGFFVAFPSAPAALACAVDVQRTFKEHRRAHGFAPQIRIGLHTAAAFRSGRGWRGKGVHEAARIAALGGGGQIVGSAATLEEAGAAIDERWQAELKGVQEPVAVATVAWH